MFRPPRAAAGGLRAAGRDPRPASSRPCSWRSSPRSRRRARRSGRREVPLRKAALRIAAQDWPSIA
ncbi:hypothetical protein DDZ18_12620 [Marinicauda salina]|uniref:Uncharacterized protein n=1 Tax=Marinicauda salina TaxID=2135793 RepID=A0A2U2BRG5_9PROT|nr:hypothetical protein DDZ18_12620 [Marinicauda salina]